MSLGLKVKLEVADKVMNYVLAILFHSGKLTEVGEAIINHTTREYVTPDYLKFVEATTFFNAIHLQ